MGSCIEYMFLRQIILGNRHIRLHNFPVGSLSPRRQPHVQFSSIHVIIYDFSCRLTHDISGLGLTMPKRVRIAGMTFYTRNGQVIGRESATHEKRSNTLPQFVQRQKILLATIGAKYNKTAAQVALRWLTQRGIVAKVNG